MRAVLIGIFFAMTILTIGAPLIDKVLTTNVINTLDSAIDNIEFFVGSNNTNIFLLMIATILIITIYRRTTKFWLSNNN